MSEEIVVCKSCWEEDCVCDYEEYITIDEGIFESIRKLNLKGYRTNYGCEGHIKPYEGIDMQGVMDIYIMFNERFENIPEGFQYPRGKKHTDIHHTVLYKYVDGKLLARIDGKYKPYNLEEDRLNHLHSLEKWVDDLPIIDKEAHPNCYTLYLLTGEPRKPMYRHELNDCETFKVVCDQTDYEKHIDKIVRYGGKVLDINETSEGLICIYYYSQKKII